MFLYISFLCTIQSGKPPRLVRHGNGYYNIQAGISSILTKSILFIPAVAHAAVDSTTVAPMQELHRKASLNLPSNDFWYPPYMIGRWNTTYTFTSANFTDKIPLEVLAKVGVYFDVNERLSNESCVRTMHCQGSPSTQ
jgi:hypothetical protein